MAEPSASTSPGQSRVPKTSSKATPSLLPKPAPGFLTHSLPLKRGSSHPHSSTAPHTSVSASISPRQSFYLPQLLPILLFLLRYLCPLTPYLSLHPPRPTFSIYHWPEILCLHSPTLLSHLKSEFLLSETYLRLCSPKKRRKKNTSFWLPQDSYFCSQVNTSVSTSFFLAHHTCL